MPLEIAEDRAVAGSLLPRPVVDTEHLRCLDRCRRRGTHEPQQGVSAGWHPDRRRQPLACLAAEGEADRRECGTQAMAASGTGGDQRGETFAKRLARAIGGRAEEAAGMDEQGNGTACTREIGDATLVAAVDPATAPMAERTRRRRCGGRDDEREAGDPRADISHMEPTKLRKQGSEVHGGLLREGERCEGV